MVSNTILAIESSCDETSAAVLHQGKLCSNIIATQEIHKNYGGVVPELASRAHEQNIVPVVDQALQKAKISKNELNAVAFTKGPGLLGALLVGASFAKSMAWSLGIPLVEVHHMHAHVYAHFIDDPKPEYPFLCMTVSGGHTQLVLMEDEFNMKIIGQTTDDAAGEAFDKTAKLMGLPYPGGPYIDKYAAKGNPESFTFPIIEIDGYDYSFSGLKTAILYFLQKKERKEAGFIEQNLPDICASVQHTIIQILFRKLNKVIRDFNVKTIGIAGGVSANRGLRESIKALGKESGLPVFIPDFEYCTDNAGMIAMAAAYQLKNKNAAPLDVSPDPRLSF